MTTVMTNRDPIALAAVCLASMMFGLEISSIPTILPTLEGVLHADFQQLQWIMNAYTIAVTTVLMATGTLADRFGRKRVLVIAIVLFGLASLVCGLAHNATILIISRALQGASGGTMLICQVAVLSHQFREGVERSRAFAAWGIVFGTGLGFGPIIGAGIVAIAGWPWVFLIHAVLAVAAATLAVVGIAESCDPRAGRLDLTGMLTLSVTVFCLAFFITQGPDLGFTSPAAMLILLIAAASFGAFLLAERYTGHPMFDFSVFRIRAFSGALLGSMGMNFSFWPFMIYLPIFFHRALGYDNVTAGMALLAYTLPTLVVPPLGERILIRYDARVAIPFGMFTIGLGFMVMWLGSGVAQPNWMTLIPGCLIAGIGLGLTNTPVTNATTGSVSGNRAGMASGIDMSARMISLAINIALMGFILVAGVSTSLRSVLPDTVGAERLRHLAEQITSGNGILPAEFGLNEMAQLAAVRAALVYGFRQMMLFGGVSVWLLAIASFLTFGVRGLRPTFCHER